MSNVRTYPETEGAVRTWLRSLPSISSLVATRVFFGVPENVLFPLIIVRQVGGGPGFGDTPIGQDTVQLDCWGTGTSKASAAAVKGAVVNEIESLSSGTPMGENTAAVWAQTQSVIWLPDIETDQARYIVTAEFALTAI